MSFEDFARKELELAGMFDEEKDFYGGGTGKAVMELIEVFDKQGHSGMSASLVRQIFHRLANWEPITPLTGEDDEWNEVTSGLYQNKRCPSVFKDEKGAYNMDGKVFVDSDGSAVTNKDSRVYIEEFPYTPKTEFIKR